RSTILPRALATRCVSGFSATSTIHAWPRASKWLRVRVTDCFFIGTPAAANYHREMLQRLILLLLLGFMPGVLAQALPEVGDVSAAAISPIDEYRLGENIMREIRRDPAYLDDPEVADYANSLGNRLVARSDASRQEFEFFVVRDPQINAFALPGGFIGIHTGLILA